MPMRGPWSGSTVVVVGDGAVGLMAVLATKQMGAGRIIAMSHHKTRQDLALEYGATDIKPPPAFAELVTGRPHFLTADMHAQIVRGHLAVALS